MYIDEKTQVGLERTYREVPRNLIAGDQALQLMGRGFTWKQVTYLTVGTTAAYGIFTVSHLSLVAHISLGTFSVGVSFLLSICRIKGQELDELLVNYLIYLQHRLGLARVGESSVKLLQHNPGNTHVARVRV